MRASDLQADERAAFDFSLTQLRAFSTVARTLSYVDAAAQLGYSEPAVHHQVKRLEAALGCELVKKAGRQLDLTAQGRRLLSQCDVVLREAETLPRLAAQQHDANLLTIAAGRVTAAYMLPDLIVEVRRRDPTIRVQLTAHGREEVIEQVRSGQADIGLSHSLDQLVDPDEFTVTRWRHIEYDLFESTKGLSAGEPTVFAVDHMTAPLGSVINRMTAFSAVPRVSFVPSADAVKSMCMAGLGYGFLRRECVTLELAAGVVRRAAALDAPIESSVWAIQRKRDRVSASATRFIELTSSRRAQVPATALAL